MEQTLKKDGSVDKRSLRPVTFREGMKLDPTKAKRVEVKRTATDARPYKTFVFDCADGCGREVRVSHGALYKATGKCPSCVSKTRPYQHLYGMLVATARHRNLVVDLTYEDLVEYTKVDECTYCGSKIEWEMWSGPKGYSKAYNLDRKDNAKGYSKDNCVVCCTACNFIRRDELTHEEMLILSPGLREVMRVRHLRELNNIATEFN